MDCLEGLGLYSALETYITGLTVEGASAFGDDDKEVLREKMFECRLYAMQWNDSLFQPEAYVGPRTNQQPTDSFAYCLPRSYHVFGGIPKCDFSSEQSSSTSGFYELIADALDTLQRDEFETSCHQLRAARLQC